MLFLSPSGGGQGGGLRARQKILRHPTPVLMPPEPAVGVGWAAIDVYRGAVVETDDHVGLEAGSLAYIGAVTRNANGGIVVDQRAQLLRQPADRTEEMPAAAIAVDV